MCSPGGKVAGFTGAGFLELDRSGSVPAEISVDIPETEVYTISFRYANGNGPVNTENKAGVRTLTVDGFKAATMVFLTEARGTGMTGATATRSPSSSEKGTHRIGLRYLPEDENMNIATNHLLLDCLRIEKH